ncbi:hypothetical protein SpCBS45565_g03322 [Spizellomyces sp. 'palustris']|nr:hypothetical protein SpCBS45565_g03322 [Spizellomyces sp. 'palustris']
MSGVTTSRPPPRCLACSAQTATYAPSTCGHISLCKTCAMKQATGGKCKVCKEWFGDVKRIVMDQS